MRDAPFHKDTVSIIAQKAGYICSKPGCRQATIGPSLDGQSVVLLGEACHILPASDSSRAPRHQANVAASIRAGEDNGIWMCPTHSTLVDKDWANYPEEDLRQWKCVRESEQRNRLHGKPESNAALCFQLLQIVESLRSSPDSEATASGLHELREGVPLVFSHVPGGTSADDALAPLIECDDPSKRDAALLSLGGWLRNTISANRAKDEQSETLPKVCLRLSLTRSRLADEGELTVQITNVATLALDRFSVEVDCPAVWPGWMFIIDGARQATSSGAFVTKAKRAAGVLFAGQTHCFRINGHWFPVDKNHNAKVLDEPTLSHAVARVFLDGLKGPVEFTFPCAEILRVLKR